MKLLGVILSGGKSSRMGTDKGLLHYQGKPLVQYAIDALNPVCDELVMSTNSLDYLKFGYQTIPDLIPGIGPIGGIFSVMKMLKAEYYLISSCDTPNVSHELAKALLNEKKQNQIVVPTHSGNKVEPLFALYSYDILGTLKDHIEKQNYKLMNLLDICQTYYLNVEESGMDNSMFKNINTQTDIN